MTAARIVEIYVRYDLWNEVAAALCARRKRTIFTDDACGPFHAEQDACCRAGVSGCAFPHFVLPFTDPTFSGIVVRWKSRIFRDKNHSRRFRLCIYNFYKGSKRKLETHPTNSFRMRVGPGEDTVRLDEGAVN